MSDVSAIKAAIAITRVREAFIADSRSPYCQNRDDDADRRLYHFVSAVLRGNDESMTRERKKKQKRTKSLTSLGGAQRWKNAA